MNIVVVGAGFGGLAAACLLAKQGHKVSVLEKNDQPGGRARMEKHQGFSFDMGPSWYLMPEVFEKLFDELEEDITKYLNLQRLDPGYAMFFDGEKVSVGKKEQLKELFASIEKGAGEKLEKYLKQAQYQYETAMEQFIYKEYKHLRDFFTVKLLKESMKLNLFSSLHSYVKRNFKDHRLQKILEYSMVFLGGSPSNTPALYSLMSHVDLNQGVYYPKGGMHAVAKALETIGKKLGVNFQYETAVTEVVEQNSHVVGVRTENKLWEAEKVVMNADYAHAQINLVKKQMYAEKYWQKRTIAPSAFILYLGVQKLLPQLEHHNLFIAKNWNVHFDEIFKKPQWPSRPSYYVCNPSKTQADLAPKGMENLFFLVPVAPGLEDTPENRTHMRNMILKDFQQQIETKIDNAIVYERSFAHKDFKEYYNAYKGTALGLTHTMRQTALFRPKHKDSEIEGLYYTGHYTHPGIGVPMVIISSQILVEEYFQ